MASEFSKGDTFTGDDMMTGVAACQVAVFADDNEQCINRLATSGVVSKDEATKICNATFN